MTSQCQDILADRELGAFWEKQFGRLAMKKGLTVTPNQIGRSSSASAFYMTADGAYRRLILPDFVIWSLPGQHHEIKHKDPAKTGKKRGCYGLERYRFDSLVRFQEICGQSVFYTIHDWSLAGGKQEKVNHIDHWLTIPITDMVGTEQHAEEGLSWINGTQATTELVYWPSSLFVPLSGVLDNRLDEVALKANPLMVRCKNAELALWIKDAEMEDLRARLMSDLREKNAFSQSRKKSLRVTNYATPSIQKAFAL